MERSNDTTSLGLYGGGEVGAGGKFRKPPARKPPSTPYDRPLTAKQTGDRREGSGGWLSKIVDPAYRLISSGSTRFLPSFFSKSPSGNATPLSDTQDDESDQDASGDDQEDNLNLGFRSSEVAGPSRAEDEPRCEANFDEQRKDRKGSLSDDSGLSEIEQLLKGKSLSRDEINRLTVILNSKATGLSNVEQGNKKSSMTAEGEAVGALVAHETPRTSTEGKLEGSNKAIWATSTPLPPSTIQDVVGASPVEIARAYMGSRTSEMGLSSRSLMSKDERVSADEFASKPAIPLPSPKPTCWPGAIVQDQRGYMTPQNERGRLGLHSFPRTPYSRTIFSKSKSKLAQLQSDSNRCLNTSSTPFQQFRTPASEEVRSRGDGYGSVGPIRRIRHKVVEGTPSRGSVALHSSINNLSNKEETRVYAGFSSAFKNLEPGVTSSTSKFQPVEIKPHGYEVGHTTVPPQSSQIARKILEHIDRKMPTLAEKSAEIKLAIASKRPPSSEVTTPMLKEDSSSPTVESFDSRKNTNRARQTFSAKGNEYAANFLFKGQTEERSAREANDEGSQNTSASTLKFGNAGPSFGFSKNSDSQIKSMHEKASMVFNNCGEKENSQLQPLHNYRNGQGVSKTSPNATGADVLNLQKPRSHSSCKKLVLPSISIGKPGLGTVSLNSGFTFPVSASSGALSEPPTPSIMPSLSSAIGLHQTEGAAIPTYTFGSKRSASALVFSFPSTSNSSALVEASEIMFTFGSDNNSRLSFSSKDAICH